MIGTRVLLAVGVASAWCGVAVGNAPSGGHGGEVVRREFERPLHSEQPSTGGFDSWGCWRSLFLFIGLSLSWYFGGRAGDDDGKTQAFHDSVFEDLVLEARLISRWVGAPWPAPSESSLELARGGPARVATSAGSNVRGRSAMPKTNQAEPQPWSPLLMKYLSLILLVVQTTGTVIPMRWSRIATPGRAMYVSSTAVVLAEVVKFLASAVLLVRERGSIASAMAEVRLQFTKPPEALQLAVPGILYALQNNLLFLSLSNLSGAVHQVSYQLKILTTAVLSVLILGKPISCTQWASLVGLTIGVMLIQLPQSSGGQQSLPSMHTSSQLLGFAAILGACFTSGFAGVYLEKLIKQSKTSIWVRNMQLSLIGMTIGLATAFIHDGEQIWNGGFLQGYSSLVWFVVVWNAVGGMLVAMVMKYADNILKCFAAGVSIILTCLLSFVLGEFSPSMLFVTGTLLVIASSFTYGSGLPVALSPLRIPFEPRNN